jgi:hypothetical protein
MFMFMFMFSLDDFQALADASRSCDIMVGF